MPELPEVETIRRGLEARLVGRRILRAQVRRPDLRGPLPPDLAERLEGRRVLAVGRRAKYLLLELDSAETLLIHLGMSGRLLLTENPQSELDKHDHIILEMQDGLALRYNDARRFGMVDVVPQAELAASRHLAGLGPEPLGPDFTAELLSERLSGRQTPIKSALLDQHVVAGIGNIYASEALFRAGISPVRMASTVPGRRAAELVAAIRSVLTEAIAAGGSSLRDYVQATGELGYFQHRWAVYDRAGQPCPTCDGEGRTSGVIQRIVQAGRSSFFCPHCQR